jgi:phosphohistidine phosphatase
MKTLILLRHAKSEDPSLLKNDFKRNLKSRGINDIRLVANEFAKLNLNPNIVLCSAANRTKETLAEFQSEIKSKFKVTYLEDLYHADASTILDVIQNNEKLGDTIMVVGHNFGISVLANYIGNEACEELPTSGLVVFQFANSIKAGEGRRLNYITPKSI